MTLQFHQFAYNSDNYGVLIHEPSSGETACIDAGDMPEYQGALNRTGWSLSEIWITHHHWDHTDGLKKLKAATGAKARGPEGVAGVDETLAGGDKFTFAGHVIEVIHTPGHTLDMLNFHIPSQHAVFTGDTLFSLGCGRIFEGTPEMMWESLSKLAVLPKNTVVYSSHEYTLANAQFALSVDPDNADLKGRASDIEDKRKAGAPTVPSLLSDELATNPFLRAKDPAIRAHLGLEHASDAEVFAEIRKRKDSF